MGSTGAPYDVMRIRDSQHQRDRRSIRLRRQASPRGTTLDFLRAAFAARLFVRAWAGFDDRGFVAADKRRRGGLKAATGRSRS